MNDRLAFHLMGKRRPISRDDAGSRLRRAERVLLIKLDQSVSHLLVATPVLRNLRRALPEAEISFLAGPGNADAVKDNPDLDAVSVVSLKGPLGLLRFLRTGRRYRQHALDAAIVLSTNYHTQRAAAMARRCRPQFVVGFDDSPFGTEYAQGSYDCILSPPEDLKAHVVDYHLHMLESLGIPVAEREHVLGVTADQARRGQALLAEVGVAPETPVIGAHVGGVPDRPEQQWSPANYASVLQRAAAEAGFQPVILGTSRDRPSIDTVLSLGKTPIPALLDLSFAEYKAVVARMQFFLTHDGEPVHVAAGVKTPLFAIFLSTPPWRGAPYGPHVSVWEEFGRAPTSAEVWERIKPRLAAGS